MLYSEECYKDRRQYSPFFKIFVEGLSVTCAAK